jgi:AraC family transcriptional regulator of arabinose operon
MNTSSLLSYHLSNLKVELYTAHFNTVTPAWRDIDYTPDYSKFYYIVGGAGRVKIGNEEYFPEPGQLVLMPEGVKQSYSIAEGEPYTKYWCHFSAKIGDINVFKLLNLPFVCSVQPDERVRMIFAELVQHANSDAVYAKLLAKAKLLELVSYYIMLLEENTISFSNPATMERLDDILTYIHANLDQDVSIQELAQRACLHPNYFIRMFKEQMGVPPIQYIMRLKIEKAKELLAQSSCSISEIAERVGFHDIFHFSKQFKKIAGLPPSDFRKYGTVD